MSSIHELPSIIDRLEKRLKQYKVDSPTDKQKQSMEMQYKLIEQLQSVYDQYKRLVLWDVWVQSQKEIDAITTKDPEIDGVILKFPLKENAKNFAYINFTI
jgi:hypothetical protein